jgi:hypothetical protein
MTSQHAKERIMEINLFMVFFSWVLIFPRKFIQGNNFVSSYLNDVSHPVRINLPDRS